jgi:hypothetical protein
MSDELAVRQEFTITDIDRMGAAIAASGLFGITKKEQAIALMLVAQSQGRHPASVAEEYDIIQNRPALRSRAALARYQIAGGRIEWLDRTAEKVSARFSHPSGGELVVTWDIARARAMGLDAKDNWKKQPMVMLSWRVVAEGIRMTYPACLSGEYIAEEVEDLEPRNVTPERPALMEPQPKPAPMADVEPEPTAPNTESKKISEAQRRLLFTRAKGTGHSEEDIKFHVLAAGFEHTADITVAAFDKLLAWAETKAQREPGEEG